MKLPQLIGVVLFSSGFFLMLFSTYIYFRRERKHRNVKDILVKLTKPIVEVSGQRKNKLLLWGVLCLIIAGGAFLRLNNLGDKSISHPEVYVPGINLPADISEPPPRTTIVPLLYFHFLSEPHPPAYYFFMFGWTKIFGTSLESIRFPSVLIGLLSIFLIFQIARLLFNEYIGLVSAALLAFNGHQIYWSQNARMYAMTCFLGLLSIFFLIKLLRTSDNTGWVYWGAAYVLTGCLGVYTEIVFWTFLAGQMFFIFGWQIVTNSPEKLLANYIFRLQSIIIMVGAPMWAHAVYKGRISPFEPLSTTFLGEFISFGFLFERDIFSQPTREISSLSLAFLTAFASFCIAAAFVHQRNKVAEPREIELSNDFSPGSKPERWFEFLLIAFSSIVTIIGFNLIAKRRNEQILLTCLVPIAALFIPFVIARTQDYLQKFASQLKKFEIIQDSRMLLISVTFVPVILLIIVSLFNSLLVSRLFLIFTPYLLILIAVGIFHLSSRITIAIPLGLLVLCLHIASVSYYFSYPISPNDYKNLANQLHLKSERGDQLFVIGQNWFTTPLFYYLDDDKLNIVAENFGEITSNPQTQRVWLLNFHNVPPNVEMLSALSEFHPTVTISARYTTAVLYERNHQ